MSVDAIDTVFLTAIFILPGFLISGIIDAITPPKKESEGIFFLRCLAYSIINCALWSWLYSIILNGVYRHVFWLWILMTAATVIGASLLAAVLALIKQSEVIKKAIEKLGIKTIHSTPTAWDYLFSRQEASFVIVTIVDGTLLYGWYSSNSFSSSDQEERDLFIEKAYSVNKEGVWELDTQSEGFYIPKDQIKYIEFKKGAKKDGE